MDWRKETKKAAQDAFDEINDTYFRICEAKLNVDPKEFIEVMMAAMHDLAQEWLEELEEVSEEEEEDPTIDEFEPGRVHWSQFAANP